MFTGIIEEVGTVKRVVSGSISGVIEICASKVLEGTKIGDSIAVNGVCLTVTSMNPNGFTADVMPETLRRTNLGKLKTGDQVDLERAMAANGRFGGHMVTGHIDGTGILLQKREEGNAVWVTIETKVSILEGIVEKGSIAIDGISLTVAKVNKESFSVSLIPHTGKETILLKKAIGTEVNLENDIVGKYVRRLLGLENAKDSLEEQSDNQASKTETKSRITMDFLREHGF